MIRNAVSPIHSDNKSSSSEAIISYKDPKYIPLKTPKPETKRRFVNSGEGLGNFLFRQL